MAASSIRAASCPKCRVLFEAASKQRQRCPACGHRFALAEGSRPAGFGSGGLQAPAYAPESMRRSPVEQAYSSTDRMLGALVLAVVGAALVWSGLRFDSRYVTFVGVAMLMLVAPGALMSSFWRRWDDLSPGQRQLVDLPRRVVWAVARVLAGILEFLIRLIGSFG